MSLKKYSWPKCTAIWCNIKRGADELALGPAMSPSFSDCTVFALRSLQVASVMLPSNQKKNEKENFWNGGYEIVVYCLKIHLEPEPEPFYFWRVGAGAEAAENRAAPQHWKMRIGIREQKPWIQVNLQTNSCTHCKLKYLLLAIFRIRDTALSCC